VSIPRSCRVPGARAGIPGDHAVRITGGRDRVAGSVDIRHRCRDQERIVVSTQGIPAPPVFGVLGLGETGMDFTGRLVAAGAQVYTYDLDPALVAPSPAVRCTDERAVTAAADVVLSVVTARNAAAAVDAAKDALRPGLLWADLNTAEPQAMRDLDAEVTATGADFVDVSIMARVPGRSIGVPMIASGPHAARFAEILGRFGAHVDVLDAPAGAAAERKLLRSVFYKGMASAIVEAVTAARARGVGDWSVDDIGRELAGLDETSVLPIIDATITHAARRADEMGATAAMLDGFGVPSDMSAASAAQLRRLAGYGEGTTLDP